MLSLELIVFINNNNSILLSILPLDLYVLEVLGMSHHEKGLNGVFLRVLTQTQNIGKSGLVGILFYSPCIACSVKIVFSYEEGLIGHRFLTPNNTTIQIISIGTAIGLLVCKYEPSIELIAKNNFHF